MTSVFAILNDHCGIVLTVCFVLIAAFHAWSWHEDQLLAQKIVSKFWQKPNLNSKPRIAILVAAWNEAEIIEEHIRSVISLRYPNKEYILCAGGNDETFEIARRFSGPNVNILQQRAHQGKQHSLQSCLDATSAEIIYLTDADCLLDDENFERVIEPLINMDEAVVTGTSQPLRLQQQHPFVMHRWFTDIYSQARWGTYITGILGRNVAIQRRALISSGAFLSDVRTGTDYILAKRVLEQGYRIRYVASSNVETSYSIEFRAYQRRELRWLRNVAMHGLRHGAFLEVARSLMTSVVGLGMLAWGLWGIIAGGLALCLWLAVFGHVLLSRMRYMRFGEIITKKEFPKFALFWLPVYTLCDFAIWASALVQYPVRSWRTRW